MVQIVIKWIIKLSFEELKDSSIKSFLCQWQHHNLSNNYNSNHSNNHNEPKLNKTQNNNHNNNIDSNHNKKLMINPCSNFVDKLASYDELANNQKITTTQRATPTTKQIKQQQWYV